MNKDKNTKDIKRRQIISLGQILSKLQQNLEVTEGQILHLESHLNDLRALKQAIIKKIHDIEKDTIDIEVFKYRITTLSLFTFRFYISFLYNILI